MFIRLLKNMLRENLLEKGNLCMYIHSLDVGTYIYRANHIKLYKINTAQ